MLKTGLNAVLILGFGFVILVGALPDIVTRSETVRTNTAQETGLGCSTGVGQSSCDVTLASTHAYADTTAMTVTETSPGATDRTATSSLNASDRTTLSVGGLSPSTAYGFTVDYAVVDSNVSGSLNQLLTSLPLLLVIGLLAIVAFAVAKTFSVI